MPKQPLLSRRQPLHRRWGVKPYNVQSSRNVTEKKISSLQIVFWLYRGDDGGFVFIQVIMSCWAASGSGLMWSIWSRTELIGAISLACSETVTLGPSVKCLDTFAFRLSQSIEPLHLCPWCSVDIALSSLPFWATPCLFSSFGGRRQNVSHLH